MIPLIGIRRRRRIRFKWVLLSAAFTCASALGGYALYAHQRERNTDRLLEVAAAAADRQEWLDSINAYRQYLRRRPSDKPVLLAYADLTLARVNDSPDLIGDAVRTLQRLTQLDPSDPDPMRKLALLYLDLREYSSADAISAAWARLAPDTVDAVIARARSLHGLRKDQEAANVLLAAIERMPGQPRLYPPLIELQEQSLKQTAEAEAWLQRALANHPGSFQVQLAGFSLYGFRGQYPEAERHLQEALRVAPGEPDVLVRAINFYLTRERLGEARELLDRADQHALSDRRLLIARAHWATQSRDPSVLAETADRLVRAATEVDLDLIAQAAELYLRSGRLTGVDDCIERLAAAPYGRSQAALYLDGLTGARALFDGDAYAAIPRLERVLRKQPSSRWAMELLAVAYRNTGALDEAADLYRRIIVLSPQSNAARINLARLELQSDDPAEAIERVSTLIQPTADEKTLGELVRIAASLVLSPSAAAAPQTSESLEAILTAPPYGPAAAQLLARCLVLLNQPERAVSHIRDWLHASPTEIAVVTDLNHLLLTRGHFETAESWARELIAIFPQATEGHDLLVRVYALTNRLEDAADHVRRTDLPSALRGELMSLLADAYFDAGRQTEALETLRAAAQLAPRDIAIRRSIVRNAESDAQAQAAIEEIHRIEGDGGMHADYERAWRLLYSSKTSEEPVQAVSLLQGCLSARPGWVSARLLLAYAQELIGQLEEAAESYRTARAQRPELAHDVTSVRFIELLKTLGRYDEADNALEKLSAAAPDSFSVLRLQLDQQLRNRQVNTAAVTAERILQIQQDDPAWAAMAADLQLRAGAPAEAERIARAALDHSPDSGSLLWSLARALTAQGRFAEAESYLRTKAAAQPAATPWLILAKLLLQAGRGVDAEAAIENAVAQEPQSASMHQSASEFWGLRGDRSRQLLYARKAVTLAGGSEDDSLPLAALLAGGQSPADIEESMHIVQNRLSANPQDMPAMLLHAHLLTVARPARFGDAERIVREALALNPRSVEAYKILAAIQARTGQVKAASDTIASALVFSPEDPDLLLTRAEIESNRGEFVYAIPPLRRLLQIQPRDPRAIDLLTEAYLQTRRINQGIRELEDMCAPDRCSAAEFVHLARLYEAKPDIRESENLLQKAIDLEPNGPAVSQQLRFLARQQRYDEIHAWVVQHRSLAETSVDNALTAAELLACQDLRPDLTRIGSDWLLEVHRTHPNRTPDAAFRMGICLYNRGDVVNAETMFLKARSLAPQASRPVNALAWIYSEDLGQPARALDLLDEYMEENGQPNAEMLDTYAAASLRLGKLESARTKALQAIAMAGQTPTVAAASYRLGLVQCKSGDLEDGRANLRQALEFDRRLGGLHPRERQEAARILSGEPPDEPKAEQG